jgi:hypothetical protein
MERRLLPRLGRATRLELVEADHSSVAAAGIHFQAASIRAICAKSAPCENEDIREPSVREYHPQGTNSWFDGAPIAIGYFPYNRCNVYECKTYLRCTEFGGYHRDERVAKLILN